MNLNKQIIIISFFVFSVSFANEKEEVLFEIEGAPITTIDLNQRINYLKLFNSISENELDNNIYFNDLISVMIFNQFSLDNKIKTDTKIIEDYYNLIINNYEKNHAINFEESIYYEKLSKEIIKKNIIYDLQRKKILEILLKENKNNLTNKLYHNNLINTFEITLNYFIIQNQYKEKFEKINNILLINNIEEIHKILNDNKIKFNFYNKNISNFSSLDDVIRTNIFNNVNEFIIYQNEYFLLGIVNKIIKKNIDLRYSIYQIEYTSKNDLSNKDIHCDNINDIINNKLIINKYDNIEIEKLHNEVIEKLSKRNDTILIETNNQKYLHLTKHHINRLNKKELTISEIFSSKVAFATSSEEFKNNNVELQENTPEEIRDFVIEMDERLNGNWKETEEDIFLQKEFWSIFEENIKRLNLRKPSHGKIKSKFCTKFLRENKNWIR